MTLDDLHEHPAERLRRRLAALGVRELVEWDTLTEEERAIAWGFCPLHPMPLATRFTVRLDDADAVHATLESVCRTCEDISQERAG